MRIHSGLGVSYSTRKPNIRTRLISEERTVCSTGGVHIQKRHSANAQSQETIIYAGSINRDHVHMLIGIPPQLSVSKAVQFLKGKSSHRLLTEYGALRKRYWGQHLWARGYWVASSGNVTDEVWKEYIKNQTPPEPDDDFHVV